MDDEQLNRLLEKADSSVTSKPLPADLARRVRLRARSRARVRWLATATALMIACNAAVILLVRERNRPQLAQMQPAVPHKTEAQWRAQLKQISDDTAQHEATIARLQQLESLAAMRRAIGSDPTIELAANRAAAAGILVARANDLALNRSIPQAIIAYQRVIDLFSETAPARTAQARLREIKTSSSAENHVLFSGAGPCHEFPYSLPLFALL